MKKVIMSVIAFGIAAALIVAVWMPLATKGKDTGVSNENRYDTIDTGIGTLAAPSP